MHVIDPPLVSAAAIQARIGELAFEIEADFGGSPLALVCVLKGGLFFAADLLRQLSMPVSLDFIRAQSYAGRHSKGTVEVSLWPSIPLHGEAVLIVEDILDTGRTTDALMTRLRELRPARLALCTLLDKPSRRIFPIKADYVGFTIPDRFVVGYGLDCDERYRNLPAIHALEPD